MSPKVVHSMGQNSKALANIGPWRLSKLQMLPAKAQRLREKTLQNRSLASLNTQI